METDGRVVTRRLWWVGPATVVASVIAVDIGRIILVAVLNPNPLSEALMRAPCTFWTVILVTAAVLVFRIVAGYSRRPVLLFRRIALIALLLSFIPDALLAVNGTFNTTWTSAIALMVLHVVAWAVTVPMLTRLTMAPSAAAQVSAT